MRVYGKALSTVSSGARNIFLPLANMFIAVDFTPVAIRSSRTPIRSSMSQLRAWMAMARDSLVGSCELVDDPDADAAAGEFACGDEADRACADDDDSGVLGGGSCPSPDFHVPLRLVHGTMKLSLNARGN